MTPAWLNIKNLGRQRKRVRKEVRRNVVRVRDEEGWGREYAFTYAMSMSTAPPQSFQCRWNVDHIVPLVLGGADHLENLQLLCPVCAFFKTEIDMRDMLKRLIQIEEGKIAAASQRRDAPERDREPKTSRRGRAR